jgi:hypothetical protein
MTDGQALRTRLTHAGYLGIFLAHARCAGVWVGITIVAIVWAACCFIALYGIIAQRAASLPPVFEASVLMLLATYWYFILSFYVVIGLQYFQLVPWWISLPVAILFVFWQRYTLPKRLHRRLERASANPSALKLVKEKIARERRLEDWLSGDFAANIAIYLYAIAFVLTLGNFVDPSTRGRTSNGSSDCHTDWDGRSNPMVCE